MISRTQHNIMLKISLEDSGNHAVTLRLEGRIAGPWIAELNNTCEELLQQNRRVTLNLAEVAFADREAVMLLRKLQSRGIVLAECSPFTAEQLKAP